MFHFLLFVVIGAAAIHVLASSSRDRQRVGELLLLYVLVGYCGGPGLILTGVNLMFPAEVATALGFPVGNPFQQFVGAAYLGMSIVALLALRYRGDYLVAPTLVWATFFGYATFIHSFDFAAEGRLSHGMMLVIFVSHGLVSVVLLAALWMSGAGRRSGAGGGEAAPPTAAAPR